MKRRLTITLVCCALVILTTCAFLHLNVGAEMLEAETQITNETTYSTETIPEVSTVDTAITTIHKHSYKTIAVDGTCITDGYINYVCSCGTTYIEKVKATGHQYETRVIEKTCVQNGYSELYCTSCDYSEQSDFSAAIGHSYGEFISNNNATCTVDGTKTAYCTKCDAQQIVTEEDSRMGHILTEWGNDEQGRHSRHCTREGCSYKETIKHNTNVVTTVQATCEEPEKIVYHCDCGAFQKEEITTPAIGHILHVSETVPPTYTERGYDVIECQNCTFREIDNYVDVVFHDCEYMSRRLVPHCKTVGRVFDRCPVCDKKLKEDLSDRIIHNFELREIKPTCTTGGYYENFCKDCFLVEKLKDTRGPLGHNYTFESIEATTGWGGYDLHTCTRCGDSYQDNETPQLAPNAWPKGYKDETCTIIIYKEWYKNAYVYAAHITFSDYSRLWTECGNGKYRGGTETTSHAAQRVGAIFAVNGCYSSPNLDYTVVRKGKIWNGSGRASFWCPAVYSSHNGKLVSAWDGSWSTPGISGGQIDDLVSRGLVTDTFCFGPPSMFNGELAKSTDTSRAQRTFIGTNGNPGDIWICVSDGRYNDGSSAGLTFLEGAQYLKEKGCTFCVHLDGGGSSTMYFDGQVLNAAKNGQRAVVDFLVFK